ncbi:expressed unknown protein [Seminavis robusta]|uniref:Uncharacterized protein n=1 Tax=Seminavis robusta TaxID=568900 RepID=A0A9N8HG12_9STRA|nr:expressed unknown protein [Seminavis robusta]|eukprot:Sro605_g174310.1 n/a (290) ;mRNA; f:31548-32417
MLLFSVLGVNVLHLWGLWTSPLYLSWQRTLVLPFRRLLFPLVPQIARIESIREQETTQYYTASQHVSSSSPSFRKSVRRHYRRMEKIYQRHHIRHVCVDAERQLCLQQVLPILWQHQQRATSSSMPMDEFIKRTLVVTVVPDGILDLYYTPQDQLVAVQFSIWQAPHVWHWFMYFCDTGHSQAGIWWHGALLAMQRGHVLAQQNQHDVWVNAQVHQQDSKSHAGYAAASHTHLDMLSDLYPWTFTRQVPESVQQLRLWDSPAEAAASTEDAAASDTAAASSNSLIRLAG